MSLTPVIDRPYDKRTLQRLRRQAGYRSAKDFAAILNIPASTYARYERQPEGPECGIPLPSAWQIADALGCSIDLVVGRDDIDSSHEPTLDKRLDALSPGSQKMIRGFLGYLEELEAVKPCRGKPTWP